MKYATVIVPVPVNSLFTYRVPEEYEGKVVPGMRVVVPFGKGKYYTAVVTDVTDSFSADYEIKEIVWCADTAPIIRRPQLQLWNWIADYYMCTPGDVLKAALPSGMKIDWDTIVEADSEFLVSEHPGLEEDLVSLWQKLCSLGKVNLKDLEKEYGRNVIKDVYALMSVGAVAISERATERFRPKTEEYYVMTLSREDPEAAAKTLSGMRSARHQRLFMQLLQLSDFTKRYADLKDVPREAISSSESFDRTVIRSFEKKGLIRIERRIVSRFRWDGSPTKAVPELSAPQKEALRQIHEGFGKNPVVLLHGVTSSGKTEIYIHLLDFILHQKKQALFLVPEIALTTQLTRRLQAVFGDKVVVYHSRFTDAERAEIWNRLLHSSEPLVVIGARSSVFLPYSNLGLVIVDEEHEQSYKQFDPAPRYNARDVATVLSRLHGSKTLLASATPSVESYFKATTGRYGLVSLTERYGDNVRLPEIKVVDMARAKNAGLVTGQLENSVIGLVNEALQKKEQVIFFHNRRGYSPFARCKMCEFIPKCTDCDVSLTYHKGINKLVCHYCGKEYAMNPACPVCHEPTMTISGYGTERVEDDICDTFKTAKTLRMDLDTTRHKENYANLIDDFSEGKSDILVGTQMVTKGLDFGGVSTVVVVNADQIINHPDFRATERAFNMLEQVSGRAGRRQDISGTVVVQTRNPSHPVIRHVLQHDYQSYYENEVAERKAYCYPPFSRLIYIFVRHKDSETCRKAAETLATTLKVQLGNRIFGPHQPPVSRIKTMFIRRIMVKVEEGVSVSQVKKLLVSASDALRAFDSLYKGVDIYFDVDPQ